MEDEPALGVCLENDLKLEGYEVETVRDGEMAFAKGLQPEFDLILLDVILPRKDGFEVCRELRRAGVRTPIILLTARTQEAEKVLGLELGADLEVDVRTRPDAPDGHRPVHGSCSPGQSSQPGAGLTGVYLVYGPRQLPISLAE